MKEWYSPGIDRMRATGPYYVVTAMICIWLWNSVNGFRPLTAPITLSDANAGGSIRQVLFLGSACVAGLVLFTTRSINEVIMFRLREALVGLLLVGSVVWSWRVFNERLWAPLVGGTAVAIAWIVALTVFA